MPIGRRPPLTDSSTINVLMTDGTAGVALSAGQAVGFEQVLGVQKVVLASASDPDQFMGFARISAAEDANVVITTGRGSRVTPMVEGGGTLTVDEPVFLAVTPGAVTQDASTLVGYSVLKLGRAITTTGMIFKIDYSVTVPS